MRAIRRRARQHPHGVDGGHSLGVVAEPEYPRITDADEQPTTIDVILASDPELRFDGQPQRRAICTLYGADGSIAVAISDLPEDLEHGPRTLAEQLAESMMTGGRITLTGRWATRAGFDERIQDGDVCGHSPGCCRVEVLTMSLDERVRQPGPLR
jgi:hypothetical protein